MPKTIKLGRVEVNLLLLPLLALAFVFDFARYLAAAYAAALLHELAHIAAAMYLGAKVIRIEVLPFGIAAHLGGNYIKNPKYEIIIASAGPICSLLLAAACKKFGLDPFLIQINIAIALLNLFPALPLDGGSALRAALTLRWGFVRSYNFMLKLTKVFAAVLICLGAAVLYFTKFNFSALLIGAFLIVNSAAEQQRLRRIMMGEIVYSKQKLSSSCAQPAKIIAISEDSPARYVLRLLSYNRYCLISVIDSDMNILGTITETQLITRLRQKGIRTKAGEIVDLPKKR